MVKVCILSPTLPRETQEIAASLSEHQVDVVIYTQRGTESVAGTDHRTPFRTGNLWEGLRSLPALIRERAQVFHFILGPGERVPWGFQALAPLLSALPGTTTITSSFDEQHFSKNREKLLLQFSDIATFVSRDHLLKVQRVLGSRRADTRFEVLRAPPLTTPSPTSLSRDLERLLEKLGHWVLWPEQPEDPSLLEEFRASGWNSLIRSSKFDSSSIGFFTGPLLPSEWQTLVTRAGALVTAKLPLTATALLELQSTAKHHRIPLIVDRSQTRRVPGLIREGATGFAIESPQSLRDLLQREPRLRCEGPFADSGPQEMDLLINELMRCYRGPAHSP